MSSGSEAQGLGEVEGQKGDKKRLGIGLEGPKPIKPSATLHAARSQRLFITNHQTLAVYPS